MTPGRKPKIVLTTMTESRNLPAEATAVKSADLFRLKGSAMKRLLTALVCLLIVGFLLGSVGCQTVKGAGKDLQHLGDGAE